MNLRYALVAPFVVAYIGFPQLARAQYTQKFETWAATSTDTWQTRNLGGAPFNVPANAVVEVEIDNSNFIAARWGGVRAVGSGLERRFDIRARSISGVQPVIMHVQADASSQIQHYAENTSNIGFVLLGYWTSGTYVERFDTFTAGASATWTDKNLCSFGVGASHVAEIVMTNVDTANGRSVGVRANGSSIERRFTLDVSAFGSPNLAAMFVKTDTSPQSLIELYAEDDTDVDFNLVGYWSVAPLAYTEAFTDVGSPSASATWQDKDLTTSGVPDNAIAEFMLANEDTGAAYNMGVRANGSSLARLVNPHLVFAGNATVGRMHVLTDATATIEWYHVDLTQSYRFYLLGYWDTCDTSIEYVVSDLGAVTAANSSLGWHINSSAKVAVFEEDGSGDPDASFLDCGTFTSFGVLGGSDAEAHGINDNNMVVGWSDDGSGNRRAYTWTSGGGMTDLGTVGGRTDSEALSVNDNGEVVGTVLDFDSPHEAERQAFLYLPAPAYTLGAGMNLLGSLGGEESVGMDINGAGQVVGGAENASGQWRPFRWANGTMTDLGTLGGETVTLDHRAEAINSSGNLCGRSYTAGGAKRAFYYDGSLTDLGVLTGGSESWAFGLNESDLVVGTSDATGGVFRAFVWDSTNGMRNLNNLLPAGTGWTLIRATDINNDGFITGWGTNGSGDNRAFLLTPTCSTGGGGAARAAFLLASGSGVSDGDGVFDQIVDDGRGQRLARIELFNSEPGSRVEFDVSELDTRAGFDSGLALSRQLRVATTTNLVGSSLTVEMSFTPDEIRDVGLDVDELELHVLDTAAGELPGAWAPAGKTVGELAPRDVVGESGFVVYRDGSVDYWAVRDTGGSFAVGKPQDAHQPPPPRARPSLCGIAMIQPFFACSLMLVVGRWSRRRLRILRNCVIFM